MFTYIIKLPSEIASAFLWSMMSAGFNSKVRNARCTAALLVAQMRRRCVGVISPPEPARPSSFCPLLTSRFRAVHSSASGAPPCTCIHTCCWHVRRRRGGGWQYLARGGSRHLVLTGRGFVGAALGSGGQTRRRRRRARA